MNESVCLEDDTNNKAYKTMLHHMYIYTYIYIGDNIIIIHNNVSLHKVVRRKIDTKNDCKLIQQYYYYGL